MKLDGEGADGLLIEGRSLEGLDTGEDGLSSVFGRIFKPGLAIDAGVFSKEDDAVSKRPSSRFLGLFNDLERFKSRILFRFLFTSFWS